MRLFESVSLNHFETLSGHAGHVCGFLRLDRCTWPPAGKKVRRRGSSSEHPICAVLALSGWRLESWNFLSAAFCRLLVSVTGSCPACVLSATSTVSEGFRSCEFQFTSFFWSISLLNREENFLFYYLTRSKPTNHIMLAFVVPKP